MRAFQPCGFRCDSTGHPAQLITAVLFGCSALLLALRVPPPLDTELLLAGGAVRDGKTLVAELVEAGGEPAAVDPVDLDTAVAASRTYPGFVEHPFPTCYVCGPDRPDGLRIFPGRLPAERTARTGHDLRRGRSRDGAVRTQGHGRLHSVRPGRRPDRHGAGHLDSRDLVG